MFNSSTLFTELSIMKRPLDFDYYLTAWFITPF